MTTPDRPLGPRTPALAALAALSLLMLGCGGSKGGGSGSSQPASGGPLIVQVLPVQGPPIGGTTITIVGARFLEGVQGSTAVLIGGVLATDVDVLNDSTLTAVTPMGTADSKVDVRVMNSRGIGVLPAGFRYTGTGGIVGDLDGDGLADVVVAAPFDGSQGTGRVFVFYGGNHEIDRDTAEADLVLVGLAENDRFGSAVATGDVNGDGQHDLVVGAPYNDAAGRDAGAVYVFFGPLPRSGTLSAAQADVVLTGEGWGGPWTMGDLFGSCIALGDLSGDGHADILVGAPGLDVEPMQPGELLDAGAAYVFHGGPSLSSRTAFEADVRVFGNQAGDQLGSSCVAADLSGDGVADLIVGAPFASPPPQGLVSLLRGGAVYAFEGGPQLSSGPAASATALFTPEHAGDRFGASLAAGDVDGDGFADLVVSATRNSALGSETGRVYVLRGGHPLTGRSAVNADFVFSGQQTRGRFGVALSVADFNGDGYEDVLVGAPHNSFGAVRNGRAYLFLGGPSMHDEVAHFADKVYNGESIDGQYFGAGLEVVDYDQDGVADAVIGATGNNAGAPGGGRAYTFQGKAAVQDISAVDDTWTLTGSSPWGKFGHAISRAK